MKKNFVAVFNEKEVFVDLEVHEKRWPFSVSEADEVARQAIRGETTSRKNPQDIEVAVYALEIIQGELKRRPIKTVTIRPSLERMTRADFDEEMKEILSELPVEFQDFVRTLSWEHGHSSGYEEVVNYANEIGPNLKSAIARYNKRTVLEESETLR